MIRVGHGFDIHRTILGRPLVLGGVTIPWDKGLLGHSDADVLLHAITDALLGALALGDLGRWFPDTDAATRGADSSVLLRTVLHSPEAGAWRLVNVDSTVLAEQPKLAPFIQPMRESIASLFAADPERVSVKATTTEGLGDVGQGQAIAAHAVLLMAQRADAARPAAGSPARWPGSPALN